MIKHIVVAVGVNDHHPDAIDIAQRFARRLGADVELLTVASGDQLASAEHHLASLRSRTPGTTYRVTTSNDVERALVVEALSHRDELVCVPSEAFGAVHETIFGSISEQLVRDAGVPLMLIGPHARARIETGANEALLVPLDGSSASEKIMPHALAIASELGLSVRLIQVLVPEIAVPPDVRGFETSYLHNVAIRWAENGSIDYDVLHGHHPARALADYLNTHADVVIVAMATGSVSAADRIMHPSTTFSLLRHAPVPIVALHNVEVA